MNATARLAAALLLLAATPNPGHAADPDLALAALAGAAVPNAELGRSRARGILVNGAASNGTVSDVQVGAGSITGLITNTNSVNNNTGLTTVFQNTGNNSLFQSSTSIYISIH